MATKLCSKGETKAADRKLIGTGSKLLIIKKSSAWTNKELIVTPMAENFSSAVVYGQSSYYNNRSTGSRDDANVVNNRMKTLWAAKTAADWQAGYKPLFAYTARGGCPYMIRADSNYTDHQRYLEQCSVRRALQFRCFALPAGTCSSFKAYIRFWNPSWIQALQLFPKNSSSAYNFGYNKSAYVSYHFDSELCKPDQYEAEGYGQARFAMNYGESNLACLANQGRGTSSGATVTTTTYDPWNTRAVTSRMSQYNYTRVEVYKNYDSSKSEYNTNQYYADHEITGNALTLLKQCLMRKTMWMHIGFHQGSMVYPESGSGITGQWEGSTITGFASRVELRFVLTWARTNV